MFKKAGSFVFDLEADTTKLCRKLRAIAEHARALADELESIDRDADGWRGEAASYGCRRCKAMVTTNKVLDGAKCPSCGSPEFVRCGG